MDYKPYPNAATVPNRPTRKKARRSIFAHNKSLVAGARLRRKTIRAAAVKTKK